MAVYDKILYILLVEWGHEVNVPSDQKCEAFRPIGTENMITNKHNNTHSLLYYNPHFTYIFILFGLYNITAVNNI